MSDIVWTGICLFYLWIGYTFAKVANKRGKRAFHAEPTGRCASR